MVASLDRVKVIWEGTDTASPISLGTAVNSKFFAPTAALDGQTVSYLIEHQDPEITELELGRGVYTHSGATLARTNVIASTNGGIGGSAVNFSDGIKHVSLTLLVSDLQGRFISSLEAGAPDAALDYVVYWDHITGSLKRAAANTLPSAGGGGALAALDTLPPKYLKLGYASIDGAASSSPLTITPAADAAAFYRVHGAALTADLEITIDRTGMVEGQPVMIYNESAASDFSVLVAMDGSVRAIDPGYGAAGFNSTVEGQIKHLDFFIRDAKPASLGHQHPMSEITDAGALATLDQVDSGTIADAAVIPSKIRTSVATAPAPSGGVSVYTPTSTVGSVVVDDAAITVLRIDDPDAARDLEVIDISGGTIALQAEDSSVIVAALPDNHAARISFTGTPNTWEHHVTVVAENGGGSSASPSTLALTALSSGGHVLADGQRFNTDNVLLLTADTGDAVAIIPDGASANSIWVIHSVTTGTLYIHRAASTQAYTGLTGTFTVGEAVTWSGGAAIIVGDTGSVLSLVVITGVDPTGTMTGGTSGATATASGSPTDSSGTIDGAAYQEVTGASETVNIIVRSNAGSAPVVVLEGETDEPTVAKADHDQAGFKFTNVGGLGFGSTNGTIDRGAVRQAADQSPSSGTATLDYDDGDWFKVTAGGDITIALANVPSGAAGAIMLQAVNFGAHTITWPTDLWPGGAPPTLTAAGTDHIIIAWDAAGVLSFSLRGLDMS